MLVSVITACRNEREFIDRFIQSVLEQQDVGPQLELLIGDGQSDDGTRELLLEWESRDSRIVVWDNHDRTTPHGLNQAISRARGEVIIRMDVHTDYAPDYISLCLQTLRETGADNVGGPARTRSRGYFQSTNAIAYHSVFAVGGARFHNIAYEGKVDTVVYGCWPRAVFERIGLFDPELTRNQDDEFNLRLTKAGGLIWQNPRIRSWYYPRSRLRDLYRQYYQYGYWKVRVIQKHRLPASWRHLVPGLFVLFLIVNLALMPWWQYAAWLLVCATGTYITVAILASLAACPRPSLWRFIPLLPFVFATYHLGYGLGFLHGVITSVIPGVGNGGQETPTR